jgi:hypothetical protein
MRHLVAAFVVSLLARPLAAGEPTAAEVLLEARRRYRVENTAQTLRMTLVSRSGKERVRELELELRRDGEVLSAYTRFVSPPDVAGTQLVVVDHPDREDEQLLYLPALGRVTRIGSKARSGSFMGSDFRYADLELDAGEGASHTLLEQSQDWWVVETVPAPGGDAARFVTHISRGDSLPRRVEWYDQAGDLTRRMTVREVAEHDGVSVPIISVMEDLKRGSSTRLEILEIRLGLGPDELPDEHFTAAYMEGRGREP